MSTILNEDEVTSQSVGITFTYSVVLQENLGWGFSIAADLENIMISLERCLQYTRIESEAPNVIRPKDEELVEKKWPNEGKIKFENYSVKYRPNTEIVLKNLNFEINGNEKIGIVGRTGSGKSTICLCLFRILEPLEGTIYIDGEDITKIGLEILRKNLTIIPQDPCLMEGSLRYNIDPFDSKNDEEIISILKKIGFEYTETDDQILNRKIEQGGSNLSVGEKQLVCIARAIIRKTRIVVMDEATANIDMKTEEKIQKALQYVLNNSTVITVAHRIKTIIDYDRILVLDNGNVIEYDTPQNLLKNEKSLFFELYSKSTI
jgi:ABC-type multidrug transport system fused ATPase/permease subunit